MLTSSELQWQRIIWGIKDQTYKKTMSVRDSYRIAIIGCGAAAELLYLPALVRFPSVRKNLILVDRNEERARDLAEKFNLRNCQNDYRNVLSKQLDGVIIATPSHLHYPIAMDFLSNGVHVLCEKPLADSAEEAKDMIDLAGRNGVMLLANYQRRLYASNLKVKELLSKGEIGEPLAIKYFEGEEFSWPTVSGFYFDTRVSSKGVLLDRGAHVLDLICWWLDVKPKTLVSENDSFGGREAVARIQFEHKKCFGEVKLSLLGKFPCVFSVECEQGTISGDIYDFQSIILSTKSGREKRLKFKTNEKYYTDFGYTIVMNFLNVLSNNAYPLVSGEDVLKSLEWIDDCYAVATRFNMPWYDFIESDNG
jgi:predicted dehydrogenase